MGRVPRAPGACGRRGGGWARGLGALRPARPPGSAHRLFDAGNDRPRVAEAIRARGCMTPIVMISGCASPDDQRRAGEAELRFVCKPVSFAQFETMMAEVVEHAGATR